MSVTTKNIFGDISISDDSLASVAGHVAMQCYGVVDLVPRSLTDNIAEIFNRKNSTRGVRVATFEDRITVDLFIILQHGVSAPAVTDSLKRSVKYNLEQFTGMFVEKVNVEVLGLRLPERETGRKSKKARTLENAKQAVQENESKEDSGELTTTDSSQ